MQKVCRFTLALIATMLVACGPDEPLARLAFEDNSSAMPSFSSSNDYGALWGDFNNDERLDLLYMGHGLGPLMLSQTADHEFDNVTGESGIKDSDWEYKQQRDRHGASCADFDNDGNIDLFISHGAAKGETLGVKYDEFLKGKGDFTFTEITRSAGTLNHFGRGRSSVWFDYNKDGWIDLFVTNVSSNNVMYRNNGDGTFTDVTTEVGLAFDAVHAAPADFDQDGSIDLLVSWPLRLYRNDGTGKFVALSKKAFAFRGMQSFDIAWGDADNDGDLDIFVSRAHRGNLLIINEDGGFRSVESPTWRITEDNISTGIAWGDMDNDGLLDLVNIRSDGYYVYLNNGELSFSDVRLDVPAPGIRQKRNGDAALADFNDDGLLDIATDDPNGLMLLQNASAPVNSWLQLEFQGTNNNRLGIGNKIWISSQGKLIAYREYTGTLGNLRSASCSPLHVGLGKISEIDIRVQWLNGFESVLKNVRANQSLIISDAEPEQ
jgi:hypothetical protein